MGQLQLRLRTCLPRGPCRCFTRRFSAQALQVSRAFGRGSQWTRWTRWTRPKRHSGTRLPSTPGSLQEGPASADMRQYQSPCLKRGLSLDANLPNSDEVPRPHSSSELVVPVKRTFIHYDAEHLQDSPRSDGMRRCQSAPARLLSRQLGRVTEAHKAGTCKPCAYFFAKADGCRWHNSCEFCHLCPPGEIKKRKKQKKAFLRAEASKSQED